ncbi:MAG: c-type cytochrome [Gemmatimonadota bacterium]
MKRAMSGAVLAGTAAVMLCGAATGQTLADYGRAEYDAHCAVCHGLSGKGEGSFGEVLKLGMPDLTTLAKRNGGVLPVDRVMMTIDGRNTPRAHGTAEMPIWGRDYSSMAMPIWGRDYGSMAKEQFKNDPAYAPEIVEPFVRARILLLIDYLNRLQVR